MDHFILGTLMTLFVVLVLFRRRIKSTLMQREDFQRKSEDELAAIIEQEKGPDASGRFGG